MRKRTTFYLETLLLLAALVAVVLVLAQCFSTAEQVRKEAKELTQAVHLARNGAEAVAGAESSEELKTLLLGETDNAPADGGLLALYDETLEPNPAGTLRLCITWDKPPERGNGLVTYTITVEHAQSAHEIYRLETAVYLGREAA